MFVPPFQGYAVVVNVIGVASLVAIGYGIYAHKAKARVAWLLILLGQTLYVVGDLYTYTYPDLSEARSASRPRGMRSTCPSTRRCSPA